MRQRPQDTLRQPCELCPGFDERWNEEGAPPEDGLVDGVYYEWSHHSVLNRFLTFFAERHNSLSKSQLRSIGEWLSRAVAEDGEIENATATCFLEHMHQVEVDRALAPYLSRQAKEKAHA